jgi:hypothetical protein
MFIGSYGSSFCSMPGWLPATDAGSPVPSTCKNVKFVKRTRTSFGQTRITDRLCTMKHERSCEVSLTDHFLTMGACAVLIQTYKISRNRTEVFSSVIQYGGLYNSQGYNFLLLEILYLFNLRVHHIMTLLLRNKQASGLLIHNLFFRETAREGPYWIFFH